MLNSLFSLTTIFRFINFGVFLGLVIYGYKRYLLPAVLKQIHEKKLLLQNLENQKQGIKYQLSNLDQAIEHQQYLAQDLTQKIGAWSESVQAHYKQENNEFVHIQNVLTKQTALKNQKIAFEEATKKIVPVVLTALEHDLAQYFEHHNNAQKYNGDILRFIEESTR
jgi:hypothetical protein